ncbi:MAG: LysM peptidoglycan-binding domain-containing protein [Candidatus Lambdaproteobacteria bacterium]|nr:LysM peptidoglycan-binding domain-containing protein [Candidatus Lambdaproteobacteria bacterium]
MVTNSWRCGAIFGSALLLAAALMAFTATRELGAAEADRTFAPLVEAMRKQAVAYEKTGELTRALQRWEIVSALDPSDRTAKGKIPALQSKVQSLAVSNFKMALASYKRGDRGGALKGFIQVLIYEPTNRVALDYVKRDLVGASVENYEVAEGDTLARIAASKYKDASKAAFLADYNELKADAALKTGQSLKVPVIADLFESDVADRAEFDESLRVVKELVNANKFPEALTSAEALAKQYKGYAEALDMVDTANFKYAEFLTKERKFDEALEVLKRSNPKEKRVVELKATIAAGKADEAQKLYITGVKYFLDEDLENAIRAWETALVLNPNHPKANEDLRNARAIKKKLDTVQ